MLCLNGFRRLLSLINPFKHSILTFQYFSHKVLRWTIVPFAFILGFLINILIVYSLPSNNLYNVLLIIQYIFYGLSVVGWFMKNFKTRLKTLFIPYYILVMNISIILGYYRYIFGKQSINWEKVKCT